MVAGVWIVTGGVWIVDAMVWIVDVGVVDDGTDFLHEGLSGRTVGMGRREC